MTVFSVPNYMGDLKNKAAIIIIKRNGNIIPKILKSDSDDFD